MARTASIISRFPSFFQSGETLNNLYRFVEVFGKQVDIAEEDLIRVMRSHWVNNANNEDSKGFDTSEKGDLDKIFSLYVEALGGTSLLKQAGRRTGEEGLADDSIYRERIKGLISVLRNGASTKEGIIAIVAANLGIVGESPEAKAARAMIRVEEFLPLTLPAQQYSVALYEEFLVHNPNYVHAVPEIRIKVSVSLPTPLVDPTVVNLETGESARFAATIGTDDILIFLTDGTALLNGLPVPLVGKTPSLAPGYSRLRIEAGYGMPAGYWDMDRWDFARFEQGQVAVPGRFNEARWDESVFSDGSPLLDVDAVLTKYTPGAFMVRIPWDIPGYTELLDTLPDKPREQIRFIVGKVKAAGVFSAISYEKYFTETHDHTDSHALSGTLPAEVHDMEEHNFDISSTTSPYPGGLQHELQDGLVLSGMFNYSRFDSLNTFA